MDKRPANLIDDQIVAYLLSYPRSGNSWTRYIVEYITGIVTIYIQNLNIHEFDINRSGEYLRADLFDKTDILFAPQTNYPISSQPATPWRKEQMNYDTGIILKKHFDFEIEATGVLLAPGRTDENTKLVLLLRDPRECISRHCGTCDENSFSPYMKNILYYLDYTGPKQIIYYEDLRTFPEETIRKLANFILYPKRASSSLINNFMKDYQSHAELSAMLYRSYGGSYRTMTLDKPNYGIHYYHESRGAQPRNELLINVCNRDPKVAEVLRPYLIHARHQEKERGDPAKGHIKT